MAFNDDLPDAALDFWSMGSMAGSLVQLVLSRYGTTKNLTALHCNGVPCRVRSFTHSHCPCLAFLLVPVPTLWKQWSLPPHVLLSRPIGSYLLKYPSHAFLKRFLMFVREGPCLKKRPPPQQSHELQVGIDSHSRRKEQT